MLPIPTLELDSNEVLIYRGEGNSSLVVALQSKRQVIRLLKSDAKKLKNDDDVLSLLRLHIDFNVNILPKIIAHCFFTVPQLIRLELPQIERIKNLVKDKRPSFRLDKTISNCEYALLMPDYCCIPKSLSSYVNYCTVGPILAIEIKPKQGFLPQLSLFKNDSNLSIKSKICRFGLSQFYKLQKQSINSVSSYCPLDLFSGCPYRMFNALTCLIESPQNNFRVFCDAELSYGDSTHHDLMGKSVVNGDSLKRFLAQFLLHEPPHHRNGSSASASAPPASQSLSEILPFDPPFSSSQFSFLNFIRMYSLNQKIGPKNAFLITSFCSLLIESLLSPHKSHQKSVNNNNSNNPNGQTSVANEFYKLNSCNEHVFFRTFIQMFDIDSSSLSLGDSTPVTPAPLTTANNNNNNNNDNTVNSDLNNNKIVVTNGDGNPFRDIFFAANQTNNKNTRRNGDLKANLSNGDCQGLSIITNGNGNTDCDCDDLNANADNCNSNNNINSANSQSVCHLHHETLSNLAPSINASGCPCKDSLCHSLPSGCVLDTILSAQKLDSVDSSQAVKLFNHLCSRFKLLKQRLFTSNANVLISDVSDDTFYRFVGTFINENETLLDKMWRFLISLTAKDCSIMIAMQRVDSNNSGHIKNANNLESLSYNNDNKSNGYSLSGPESMFVTDPVTGHLFIVSVSITDLDYKQAYKIQRMLHNDRRMINAFRSAVLDAAVACGGAGNVCKEKSSLGFGNGSTTANSNVTNFFVNGTSTGNQSNLTKIVNRDDISP